MQQPPSPVLRAADEADRIAAHLAERLRSMRFGDIRLAVHDGRVVQMEVTEKTRFA
jgi:hypothetical protein